MSKIQHHFPNTYITDDKLVEFDKALSSFLRRIFDLTHSTTVKTMFLKKQFGGIRIRKLSVVYRTCRICHLIKMLNNNNENIKFIARNSLEIDFNKRGIPRSVDENNFLGFSCKQNGQLNTNIKGGFGLISDWPHLHHPTNKVGTQLHEENNDNNLMNCGRVCVKFHCQRTFKLKTILERGRIKSEILEKQLFENLLEIKQLPMQGRLLDIDNADYLLSQNIFRNYINDNLVTFWYKAKRNVTPCNYTLSLWYTQTSAACELDQFRIESMARILNGCKQFKNNYSSRHNRIVDK